MPSWPQREPMGRSLAELVMLPLSLTIEGIVCCHSGATLNLYRVMSCAFWGRNMRQAPVYWAVDPACSRVGRAAQTASTFLGGLCLFFVTAQVGDLVQDRRRDFAKDVGSQVRASMMAQPCFLAVEKNERMSAKSTAPSTERKPPEIFWRNFIMRPSRSA